MKKVLPFLFTCLFYAKIFAQVAGPQSGRSFTTKPLEGSEKSWIDVENAGASDHQYASFGDLSNYNGSHTDYLVATGFGFNLPSNAQITGIAVYVENYDGSASTSDYNIRIVKNGEIGKSEHSTGTLYLNLGNRDNYRTYGSNADLWGETWTAADISSADFGIALSAQRSATGTVTAGVIDNIKIAVYYFNPTTLPVKLINFSAVIQSDKVMLSWKTAEESEMDRFEVQRSDNAADFTSFGTVICNNQRIASQYGFTDYSPAGGVTYYRLMILSRDGDVSYSKVVSVDVKSAGLTTLYPSPWKKGTPLYVRNTNNKKVSVQFFTNSGDIVADLSTASDQLPADFIAHRNGMLRYKIYNDKKEITGSGTLMIY